MLDWVNLETVAVVLAIAYLLLAIKESSLCWYAAFFSTAIYVWIFGDVSLYMESALNVYYMAMAVYGWYQWQFGGTQNNRLSISRWNRSQHINAILLIAIASLVSGYILATRTDSRLPYLDSFTTWAALLTTVMVARKVIDNWLYWIVINSASIYLYWDRELYQTVALLMLYIVLSIIGYRFWLKSLHEQTVAANLLDREVQASVYATASANSR